jgi:hypothetical protein
LLSQKQKDIRLDCPIEIETSFKHSGPYLSCFIIRIIIALQFMLGVSWRSNHFVLNNQYDLSVQYAHTYNISVKLTPSNLMKEF